MVMPAGLLGSINLIANVPFISTGSGSVVEELSKYAESR